MAPEKKERHASSKLQKWILFIGVGTLLSLLGGYGMVMKSTGKYIQKIDDRFDRIEEIVGDNKKDFTECKASTETEMKSIRGDLSRIKQAVAAHTGKSINGSGQ